MIVNHKYKMLFIHVHKAAGSSIIKKILEDPFSEKIEIHMTASDIKKVYPDYWNNYFKFAIVRNPYSRVLSWYTHIKREILLGLKGHLLNEPPKTFKEFVTSYDMLYQNKKRLSIWNTQFDYLRTGKRKIQLNYIGRLENLDNDWKEICHRSGFPYSELGHQKNWGVKDHYSNYYTDEEMIKKVSEKYKNDLEYFDYKFEKI